MCIPYLIACLNVIVSQGRKIPLYTNVLLLYYIAVAICKGSAAYYELLAGPFFHSHCHPIKLFKTALFCKGANVLDTKATLLCCF